MECKKDGCTNGAVPNRKGFCLSHYQVAMRKANNRPCSVEGCEKPHFAKGYCQGHYANNKRNGTPIAIQPHRQPAKKGGANA